MDLKGSLVDTNLKIYPSKNLLEYLKTITIDDETTINIAKLVKGPHYEIKKSTNNEDTKPFTVQLNNKDIENLEKIKNAVNKTESDTILEDIKDATEETSVDSQEETTKKDDTKTLKDTSKNTEENKKEAGLYLITSDIDWLYLYLQKQKKKSAKDVPYLHVLLEGSSIEMPENEIIKRNPVLEARCVKLRAQQEAREYRKMTKTVDNVRMRFPEDSISYQLKQLNRQLIAIGQFILSIFAGFLFGFRGVEWMVGNLDFGFRLLLGVMCALIIALAEIYFLAKKLNEELNIPETIQLGGPPKFANEEPSYYEPKVKEVVDAPVDKEHQD